MARPCLYNTEEEKVEAAWGHQRTYYAQLCAQKWQKMEETCEGKEYNDSQARCVGRPHLHQTPEQKVEAACNYRKEYYDRHHEEICTKYRIKSDLNHMSLKPAKRDTNKMNKMNKTRSHKNKWARLCDDIDASLQVLIGSSESSTVLVEGLCTHFIANPDQPDSLNVLRSTHDGLEDLLQRFCDSCLKGSGGLE
ncbi:uncharacterized protein EDB91DRAFT_1080405 [Suillus paluster]|uniref:uncharacterized protein n=1 Tax=Suillus paluster TaxID=48578 RepID=UPI001B87092B|nr:uncharacterized protein EDB91DRAFT_1080405 [Suillus paluster]KAG1745511.1 hypothetical protein EDB91DRAFT_1080405 [Suillus paluster]